jgi:hypothetical protein
VEYKYATSRNIVFNHGFESKGGGDRNGNSSATQLSVYMSIYTAESRENKQTRRRSKRAKNIYRSKNRPARRKVGKKNHKNKETLLLLVRFEAISEKTASNEQCGNAIGYNKSQLNNNNECTNTTNRNIRGGGKL